jgi:hypothetical protein
MQAIVLHRVTALQRRGAGHGDGLIVDAGQSRQSIFHCANETTSQGDGQAREIVVHDFALASAQ